MLDWFVKQKKLHPVEFRYSSEKYQATVEIKELYACHIHAPYSNSTARLFQEFDDGQSWKHLADT
jgi:hypothetical protein